MTFHHFLAAVQIIVDYDLSPTEALVLERLALHANEETALAWPGVKRLATECGGIHSRTVRKATTKFVELKLISRVSRGGGTGEHAKASVYRMQFEPLKKWPPVLRGSEPSSSDSHDEQGDNSPSVEHEPIDQGQESPQVGTTGANNDRHRGAIHPTKEQESANDDRATVASPSDHVVPQKMRKEKAPTTAVVEAKKKDPEPLIVAPRPESDHARAVRLKREAMELSQLIREGEALKANGKVVDS